MSRGVARGVGFWTYLEERAGVFADVFNMENERKRGLGATQRFCLRKWKDGAAFNCLLEKQLWEKIRGSVLNNNMRCLTGVQGETACKK